MSHRLTHSLSHLLLVAVYLAAAVVGLSTGALLPLVLCLLGVAALSTHGRSARRTP